MELVNRRQFFTSNVCPDTAENHETDTFRVKTRIVSKGVFSTMQIERQYVVSIRAVDVGGRSSESDDEVSVSEYCTKNEEAAILQRE